jgi:hypothetical protein
MGCMKWIVSTIFYGDLLSLIKADFLTYFSVSDFSQRLILDDSPSNTRRSPCCTHRQRNGNISLHLTRSVLFSGNTVILDFRWCATRLSISGHFTTKGDKAELCFADATAWRLEHIAYPYQKFTHFFFAATNRKSLRPKLILKMGAKGERWPFQYDFDYSHLVRAWLDDLLTISGIVSLWIVHEKISLILKWACIWETHRFIASPVRSCVITYLSNLTYIPYLLWFISRGKGENKAPNRFQKNHLLGNFFSLNSICWGQVYNLDNHIIDF